MKFFRQHIPEVVLIEPEMHGDDRGYFIETFRQDLFEKAVGYRVNFVQDNHSISSQGTLRGLHYQIPNPQGKLVRVISGEIFDVAVDIKKTSATFGQWCGVKISSDNKKQIWIPPGFAHGFLVLSPIAEVLYKTTDYWHKENEKTIIWDDEDISIEWPKLEKIIISEKDLNGLAFIESTYFK